MARNFRGVLIRIQGFKVRIPILPDPEPIFFLNPKTDPEPQLWYIQIRLGGTKFDFRWGGQPAVVQHRGVYRIFIRGAGCRSDLIFM